MSELVSVIMPVYEAKPVYLKKAIESVLNQTYGNLELIIIEDKSVLTAEEIIKNFNDQKIKYILNPEKTNFASQLNQGITLAQGNFIARMDADDMAERGRIEKQLNFLLANTEISVVGSNLKIIDENDKIIGQRIYPENFCEIESVMRLKNVLAHSAVMFRRNAVQNFGGYTEEFGTLADYDLWSKMILAGFKFNNIQEPLLNYRLHSNATKKYLLKKQLQDTLKIKQKYFRFKNGWSLTAEARYWAEVLLQILPRELVYWMFVKINVTPVFRQD